MISYLEVLDTIFNEEPRIVETHMLLMLGFSEIKKLYEASEGKSVEFYETLIGKDCEDNCKVPCVVLKIEDLSDLGYISPLGRYDSIVRVEYTELTKKGSTASTYKEDFYKVWFLEKSY